MWSRCRVGVSVVTSAVLIVSFQAADSSNPRGKLAVETYLKAEYRFDRDVDREYATRGRVEDVTHELAVDRVSSQSVFSFPIRAGAPISHALVAVDSSGVVTVLNDLPSINALFDRPPADLDAAEVARLLAEIFLRIHNYDGYRNQGYPLGINVVQASTDIPFPELPPQPGSAIRDYGIHPPRFEEVNDKYRFTLYSWTPAGGALLRHEIWVEDNRVRDDRVETLKRWVGAHRPAH